MIWEKLGMLITLVVAGCVGHWSRAEWMVAFLAWQLSAITSSLMFIQARQPKDGWRLALSELQSGIGSHVGSSTDRLARKLDETNRLLGCVNEYLSSVSGDLEMLKEWKQHETQEELLEEIRDRLPARTATPASKSSAALAAH